MGFVNECTYMEDYDVLVLTKNAVSEDEAVYDNV
jgi:hypothetical protein